jgi:hypothetical protein
MKAFSRRIFTFYHRLVYQIRIFLRTGFSILLLFAFTDTFSQIQPGYIFGMNLSTLKLKTEGLNLAPDTQIGIHYGVIFEIPVGGRFALRPAVVLSAKGSDYEIDSISHSLSPVFVEVPVLAIYSFGSNTVRISLFAGPYFAYGMGGYKIVGDDPLKNLKYGKGENMDLRPFDVGFNFGAGVTIKGMLISAQYGIGLANLSTDTSEGSEMKNRVIGISISQAFDGK